MWLGSQRRTGKRVCRATAKQSASRDIVLLFDETASPPTSAKGVVHALVSGCAGGRFTVARNAVQPPMLTAKTLLGSIVTITRESPGASWSRKSAPPYLAPTLRANS